MEDDGSIYGEMSKSSPYMCVCVFVCVYLRVCECAFARKRGPESDIINSDRGHTPKRGHPRIGLLVELEQLLIVHALILKCAKYNIYTT